jgi:hypothetical protein
MTPIAADFGAVFDAHVAAVFTTRDLDGAMATMTASTRRHQKGYER